MTQQVQSVLSAAIDVSGANGTTGQEIRNVIDSALILRVREVSSTPVTVTTDDFIILVDATAGAITVNLLALASAAQKPLIVKKVDAGVNAVTLDGSGSEPIAVGAVSATTYVLDDQGDSIMLAPGSTSWHGFARIAAD